MSARARDLGIELGELPTGPMNAISDVAGVRVGHTTIVRGENIRTGVTVVVPDTLPCFAAPFRLNGNGEMTGLEWVCESGLLTTPIGITNTFSVGIVRDAIVESQVRISRERWHLPVVAETWDGLLNDIAGMHVQREHVFAALEAADGGPVAEGNIGGGTGMICHGFKGGIGTASRVADGYTLGVLVQANHGARRRLQIDGVAVGRVLDAERIPLPPYEDGGSIIVLVATDAPLLPDQCGRLAVRAALGVGRTGGAGEDSSGDLILVFSTGHDSLTEDKPSTITRLPGRNLNPLFYAAIEATEEAIVNALVAAETMTGRAGTVHRLEHELLVQVMRSRGALAR